MRNCEPMLILRPIPSKAMETASLLMHGLALLALWGSALDWPFALAFSALLMEHAVWRRRRAEGDVHLLQWSADGRWRLERADGDVIEAELDIQRSRSLPWWITLAFRLKDGRRLDVPLPKDSLELETFRRLRVRLRVAAGRLAREGRMEP